MNKKNNTPILEKGHCSACGTKVKFVEKESNDPKYELQVYAVPYCPNCGFLKNENNLLSEARQYLGWHCKNIEEPACFGKDPADWTSEEIIKWYRHYVR